MEGLLPTYFALGTAAIAAGTILSSRTCFAPPAVEVEVYQSRSGRYRVSGTLFIVNRRLLSSLDCKATLTAKDKYGRKRNISTPANFNTFIEENSRVTASCARMTQFAAGEIRVLPLSRVALITALSSSAASPAMTAASNVQVGMREHDVTLELTYSCWPFKAQKTKEIKLKELIGPWAQMKVEERV